MSVMCGTSSTYATLSELFSIAFYSCGSLLRRQPQADSVTPLEYSVKRSHVQSFADVLTSATEHGIPNS